jgi:hypothetical protein
MLLFASLVFRATVKTQKVNAQLAVKQKPDHASSHCCRRFKQRITKISVALLWSEPTGFRLLGRCWLTSMDDGSPSSGSASLSIVFSFSGQRLLLFWTLLFIVVDYLPDETMDLSSW